MLKTLLAALVLAGAQAEPKRPNIVLVVADDLGRDLGCYGNPAIRTPHLDRIAAEGTRFDRAYATTASCSASRSVILSGLHNHATAQFGHEHSYHHFRTYETLKTLPARLNEAGYRTGRVGKFHVGPESAYPFQTVLKANDRNPVAMAELSRDFLRAGGKPFFLYFCTSDPHRGGGVAKDDPLRPDLFGNGKDYPGVEEVRYDPKDVVVPSYLPDTPSCRAELAQYYQSVSRVDQGVGRLRKELEDAGVWENTLFLFISDHGIAFAGAKTTAYEPGLRSPCLVRAPGAKAKGVVSKAMIDWTFLTPTILEAAGAKAEGLHGRSFLSILEDPAPPGWDEIYASHTFHEVTMYYPMRVVRAGRFKLIMNLAHGLSFPFASDLWASPTWQDVHKRGPDALYGKRTVSAYLNRPRFELYDLDDDPHEVKNLAEDPAHKETLEALTAKLKAFQKRTKDPWILKWEHE